MISRFLMMMKFYQSRIRSATIFTLKFSHFQPLAGTMPFKPGIRAKTSVGAWARGRAQYFAVETRRLVAFKLETRRLAAF